MSDFEAFKVVNLCSSQFCNSLACSTAESDQNPATNVLKNRSFVAERFVRAPVLLTFQFIDRFISKNIVAVDLGLTVGQNSTTGLEIFVKNRSKSSENGTEIGYKVGAVFRMDKLQPFPDAFRFINQNLENKFGRAIPSFPYDCCRKFHNVEKLQSVSELILRITASKNIPCFASVKIWALIPEAVVEQAFPSTSTSCVKSQASKLKVPPSNSTTVLDFETSADKLNSVPEDFLDPLTLEPMVLPVLLPCGRSIDRSSLERFIQEEARQGRTSSDPYTGVPFDETYKPVCNSSLKARIDKFWSENAHLSQSAKAGRTVCRQYHVLTKQTGMNPSRKRKNSDSDCIERKKVKTYGDNKLNEADSDLMKVLAGKQSFL